MLPLVLAAMLAGGFVQVSRPTAVGALLAPPSATTAPPSTKTPSPRRTPTTPRPVQTTGPVTMTDALRRGVVLISGTTSSDNVAGTGMVISDTGEVLTNYHVVRSTQELTVTVSGSGKKYEATLVGRDATRDVALLQLKGARGLDVIRRDSDPVSTGDVVIAAGNANGQGFVSANRGNVLSMDQVIMVKGPTDNDPDERLSGLIESDAPGWPGDSGGPMFDAETEVLGMTTAGSTAKTEDRRVYAIPIRSAFEVVEQIRNGDESGTVVIGPKAYLGVTVEDSAEGLAIRTVESGSPASKAGLRKGDTLLTLGGRPVANRSELSSALDGYEPKDQAPLTWRTAAGANREGSITFGASTIN